MTTGTKVGLFTSSLGLLRPNTSPRSDPASRILGFSGSAVAASPPSLLSELLPSKVKSSSVSACWACFFFLAFCSFEYFAIDETSRSCSLVASGNTSTDGSNRTMANSPHGSWSGLAFHSGTRVKPRLPACSECDSFDDGIRKGLAKSFRVLIPSRSNEKKDLRCSKFSDSPSPAASSR